MTYRSLGTVSTDIVGIRIQSGQVTTPRQEAAAAGDSPLNVPQRAHSIGEPVPIVFARRRNSKGGILISPGATEARFVNSTVNAVTASYHLVLSEGEFNPIPVKDVFQRSCRTGTHSQTYNRRAGTWAPGNFIVDRAGYTTPVCPYYCGTTGAFPGISTMSFVSGAIPDGFDFWNRQVHVFVRGGMHVLRYEDSLTGPSDSFADLYRWMLGKSSKIPADLIDSDQLEIADTFLRVSGFTCNCWITESQNLAEWGTKWAPYFLLGTSSNNGKKGLRPVLPITSAGAINTGTITPVFTFNEDTILPGSFNVEYISLSERQPFVAQMIWKQPLEDDIGIVRTSEVRIQGTAYDGPYESHDLSEFCTTENHAVKVGAYIVAKRVYTTHTCSFTAKPGSHNISVIPGSIVRVRLIRETTGAEVGAHDYLYQVERISKTLAGDIGYECTHFPVNALDQSVVALSVLNANGSGILMSTNRTGISCDVNSSSDGTEPPDDGTPISWETPDNPFGEPVEFPFGGGEPGGEPGSDPAGSTIPPGGSTGGSSEGGSMGNVIDGGSNSNSGWLIDGGMGGGGGGGLGGDIGYDGSPGGDFGDPEEDDEPPTEGIEKCSEGPSDGFWYVGGKQVSSNTCYVPTADDVGKILTRQGFSGDQVVTKNYGTVQGSPLTAGYGWVRYNGVFVTDDADQPGGPVVTPWVRKGPNERFSMTTVGRPDFQNPALTYVGSGIGKTWQSNAYCMFKSKKPRSYFNGFPCAVYTLDYGAFAGGYSIPARVVMTSDDGKIIGKLTGVWEFSNNKVDVLSQWKGYVDPKVTIATESIVV